MPDQRAVTVRATRAATSPVIGHYAPVQRTVTDWLGTGDPASSATVYRAHLCDGTPAGRIDTARQAIAPASNDWPTEASARAAVRKAHRYLRGDA